LAANLSIQRDAVSFSLNKNETRTLDLETRASTIAANTARVTRGFISASIASGHQTMKTLPGDPEQYQSSR
jgi:hypothetical protein